MSVIGILAHVDAGKTTFSEQLLYHAGVLKTAGRVDHGDTFLDTNDMERERGITIFSGQAAFEWQGHAFDLLDTPGHADFSPEMERSLSVMDLAILVLSCPDGIQPHTETLWRLFQAYHVPVLLFLNKCDLPGADAPALVRQLQDQLSPDILDFRPFRSMDPALMEDLATRDEELMTAFLDDELSPDLAADRAASLVKNRLVFPVLAGCALRGEGITDVLELLPMLLRDEHAGSLEPAGHVYQVRYQQGQRLCFMKLDSGQLKIKDMLSIRGTDYKVHEIRRYQGESYRTVPEASAGSLIAIPLSGPKAGDPIGPSVPVRFLMEPMMASDVLFDPQAIPLFHLTKALRILEDEDPSLHLAVTGERLTLHVMGTIQLEVLREQLLRRFGYSIDFGPVQVLYQETVRKPVIGIGHYEPLRHYAEVQLRLVPGERGSGIHFRSLAHVDDLSLNWQRLIRTHVEEKKHLGVLTGSPLTDVTVELLAGRAHLKHTEGGDFREATYRAIRNALMQADSVLLEPICEFEIRIPADMAGQVTGSLSALRATLQSPEYHDDRVTLRGTAIHSIFLPWQENFMSFTHGRGTLSVSLVSMTECHNSEEVIQHFGYNPLAHPEDTPDSVFCAHGAGYTVAWNRVADFAHLEPPLSLPRTETPLD